jgi:hypothetical protein
MTTRRFYVSLGSMSEAMLNEKFKTFQSLVGDGIQLQPDMIQKFIDAYLTTSVIVCDFASTKDRDAFIRVMEPYSIPQAITVQIFMTMKAFCDSYVVPGP